MTERTLDSLGERTIAASGPLYEEVFLTALPDGSFADIDDPRAFAAATVAVVASLVANAFEKVENLEGAGNARFMLEGIAERITEIRVVAQLQNALHGLIEVASLAVADEYDLLEAIEVAAEAAVAAGTAN